MQVVNKYFFFQKGGTTFGQFGTESTPTNFTIESTVSDGDIVFKR